MSFDRRCSIILAAGLAALLGGSGQAATIAGRVTLPDGRPLMERFVYGNATHGGTAHAYDYLGTGDNGYYTLENLPVGTYSVAVVDPWYVRAQIVADVEVASAGGTYTVHFPLHSTYYSPDDNWPGGDRWRWVCGEYLPRCGSDYAQSFVATGPHVVRATVRDCEWGADKAIVVSIHEGGPAGTQIGPSRVVRSGAGHGETSWAAGEVPVTPGETYWLRARSQDGSSWAPGLGCVPYPGGQLYIDGDAQPDFDMTWSLSCDDDGCLSSYYIARHKSYDEPGQDATEWGQTFVALTTDIQMATAHMFSPGTCDLDFFIREGGYEGAQIGPTKTATIEQEVGRDQTGAALWGPGEVSVIPGETYYLGVRRHGGGTIRLSRWRERYPLGSAYHDGVREDDWDLETQIMGAEPPPSETVRSFMLHVGWNLFSLPLEPVDGDPAVVLRGIGLDGRLFRFVPLVGYRVYTGADPSAFGGDLRRGEGYWLYVDAPARITYRGLLQSGAQVLPLSPPGWLLVGLPQKTAVSVSLCQARMGPRGTPLSLADAQDRGWIDATFYWYDPVNIGYATTGLEFWQWPKFIPWRGYWVWVGQPVLEMIVP